MSEMYAPIPTILWSFDHLHLPDGPPADTAAWFRALAAHLVWNYPESPERAVALRKLLEARDAAVRAALDLP